MQPAPDAITVSLISSLKVPLGMTIRLSPSNLSLYRPETKPFTPFVTVRLPGQKLKGNATISVENQRVKIQNMTEFLGFLHTAVYAEEFVLPAHLGKLKIKLTINKGVKLKGKLHHTCLDCFSNPLTSIGLNALKGFSILAAQALVIPEADGSNFKGTVNLPNPSVVGFELVSDFVCLANLYADIETLGR
jgi:hypothetical protein